MTAVTFQTIAEMFIINTDRYATKPCYGYKESGVWKELTFAQVRQIVEKMAGGLKLLGIRPGERVGIVSGNSHLWAMADYATMCSRGALTTIYPTLTAKQMKWIVQHSESRFLFCGDKDQADKALSMIDEIKHVEMVIVLDDTQMNHPKMMTLKDLIKLGESYNSSHPEEFKEDVQAIGPDDLLALIYTSGTTGEPKGVMLTHGNLASNVEGALRVLCADKEDVFLSFLPLSHILERMAGHFLATWVGAKICYAESIEKVAENMSEVHPTLMIAVPRFYEKVYTKVIDNISVASSIKRNLFWSSIKAGKKVVDLRKNNGKVGALLGMRLKVAEQLVFSKLKEKVGGKLRFFVSGGAPLAKDIAEFFNSAGIFILEGYGLSETSPVISINPLEKNKIGTVGVILPNVEVKIASDGEILTRGPHVMRGYFKDEAATKEVMDDDGWFHTGDIGNLDSDGYLSITDRKKNILVTSGGKNVAPQPMENVLATSKWIEQIVVIGDKRKFVSAMIVPAFSNLEAWAKEKNLQYRDRTELTRLPEVKELFDRVISESMEGFAQFEKVRKYVILPDEFTIESGELTPSLKVKRNVVEKRYAELIDHLYQESEG
ncbi:MAG: long-chain fatty acid--CoA ligase [Candidatus Marinimicrobia bacterium CG08_land_8_20_14_0_20_45_22]|nr:MAG: long-chain fatty acid--CoA ligase [Candidatus Marinimicrobia bacterium CG08_land_8_20_14_0_20_45_22]